MTELIAVERDSNTDFKTIYKDWQAIRIIRDNYFDALRVFVTFYAWFFATVVGVSGYIITNRPFVGKDVHLVGWTGIVFFFVVLLISIFQLITALRYHASVTSILTRSGDDVAFPETLINRRAVIMTSSFPILGLVIGLLAWIYLIFFYYIRR